MDDLEARAHVVDEESGELMPSDRLHSILKRGYWEPEEDRE
jgi:hypothetical protein